jgi:hypothetical protein
MANPYPSVFNTSENNSTRLEGDITFTDPSNQPGGGGGGTVDSVTAGDSSITIGGTAVDPTVAVASLGVSTGKIADNAVTTGKLANGAVGVTQMTSGAATANQVATADGAGNVSYANPTGVAAVTAGDTSIVIGGTGTNPTVETASLDVISADHATGGNVSMNSHKITNLTNGSAAQDAAAFGQIPTALPPNGSAGGDLSGTYPNPTVAAIEGVAVSGTAPTANQVLTASDATHAAWADPTGGSGIPLDGWEDDSSETWTYGSFSAGPPAVGTFTVSGDVTAKYTVGTKIKLTQTTVKYFIVTSSSYSAGTTTVSITGGTSYTLASAAISSNYHSYVVNPQGLPSAFSFDPSATGFSGTPTVTTAEFSAHGRLLSIFLYFNGTSNATTMTALGPIDTTIGLGITPCYVQDNGIGQSTSGRCVYGTIEATAHTLVFGKTMGSDGGFTSSNGKAVLATIIYPI